MSVFAGTGTLTRFTLRRDRIRLGAWTVGLAATVVVIVGAVDSMFATEAERAARVTASKNPTAVIFAGPGIGLDSLEIGPILVAEILMMVLILVAILNVLTIVRHTRADEEAGRTELLRADVVGRAASMTSALLQAVVMNTVLGVATAAGFLLAGVALLDTIAVGLGVALTGLSFAAVAAATAQVVEYGRAASGLALAVLGLAFTLRAAGDIMESGGGPLSWFSPFAWVFQARPYADLRWWPLALYLGFILAVGALAFWLAARRDFGAGLVAARRGRERASNRLASPLALLARLQRTAIIAWTLGAFLLALSFGTLASSLDDFLDSNPELAEVLGGDSSDLVTGFLSYVALYLVIAASAWAIISVTRLKAEESGGRAEMLLSTATSRVCLLGSGWFLAAASAALILVGGGAGLGLGAALDLGESSWLGTGLQTTLAQLPVPLLFAGAAALAYAWSARATLVVWAWFGVGTLISFFGVLVELPTWAMRISPFELIGKVPADDADLPAVIIVCAVAAALIGAALAAFRRRDVVSS